MKYSRFLEDLKKEKTSSKSRIKYSKILTRLEEPASSADKRNIILGEVNKLIENPDYTPLELLSLALMAISRKISVNKLDRRRIIEIISYLLQEKEDSFENWQETLKIFVYLGNQRKKFSFIADKLAKKAKTETHWKAILKNSRLCKEHIPQATKKYQS